jgi:hypothetical protein
MKSKEDLYTTIQPDDVWKVYQNIEALFRSGGNRKNAKLIGPKGIRARDFDIIFDQEACLEVVLPNEKKGLSFSDNVPRLQKLGISGVVWKLPEGSKIPKDLVINYKTKDHPLIGVGKKISVIELEAKLKVIAEQMEPTEVRIK